MNKNVGKFLTRSYEDSTWSWYYCENGDYCPIALKLCYCYCKHYYYLDPIRSDECILVYNLDYY